MLNWNLLTPRNIFAIALMGAVAYFLASHFITQLTPGDA